MPPHTTAPSRRPLVGVTTDLTDHSNGQRVFTYQNYATAITAAEGVPVLLPPITSTIPELLARLDAFVLSGGDDPRTEPFGHPTDPRALPVHPDRQAFETELLEALIAHTPDTPVLGVCLGMQMQALVEGGRLDQYMPDSHPTHADHWEQFHPVTTTTLRAGDVPIHLDGTVRSKHRQAVADPGTLAVIAAAPDGVIEAICDPARRFWVGVQWHPERSQDDAVGGAVFRALIEAARKA